MAFKAPWLSLGVPNSWVPFKGYLGIHWVKGLEPLEVPRIRIAILRGPYRDPLFFGDDGAGVKRLFALQSLLWGHPNKDRQLLETPKS